MSRAGSFDPSTLPGLGIKPWLSLRRHPRAASVAFLLVLLASLPLAWIKGRSFYTSELVFQVAPSYMKNLQADKELELQSNSQYREFVNHLSNTVVRHDVVTAATQELRARGIDLRPAGFSDRKYVEQLRRVVYVRAVPDTYMVRVGIEGPKPQHLHDLINALYVAFEKTTRAEQIFGSPERLDALRRLAAQLEQEIADLGAQRVKLADQLGLATFADSTINPFDTALAQSRERLAVLSVERAQAEAALNAFLKNREIPTHLGHSIMEMRLLDNGLQTLRHETIKRSEELSRQMAGLEPTHPSRQSASREMGEIGQRVTDREADFERTAFENFRARLTATLNTRMQVEAEVRASHQALEARASEFARNFQLAMRLTADIKKRDAELAQIRDRLQYLDLEAGALGFVRLVSPALPAETPMGIGRKKLVLAGLLAALLAAPLAAVVLDLLQRRIRTVNEAEKLMGMPSAGWQVQACGVAHERFAQEQTRRFAAALIRNGARGDRRVFGFTSVKPGAGVTTCVMDAAAMLARLGARTLVVQAHGMRPVAADAPGHAADAAGLGDLLAGRRQAAGLALPQSWKGDLVDVVGFGHDPEVGLTRLDRLKDAFTQWQQDYEYVLVDLPSLLVSADAELLIELIGQVFLVVDAEAVSRGEVDRARRLLQRLDPQAVGLFVNRVPVFEGAGYLEPLMVETLTRARFDRFMSLSKWRLSWEAIRLQWARKRLRPCVNAMPET